MKKYIILIPMMLVGCTCNLKFTHDVPLKYEADKEVVDAIMDKNLSIDSIVARHIRALGGEEVIKSQRFVHEKVLILDKGSQKTAEWWTEFGVRSLAAFETDSFYQEQYMTSAGGFYFKHDDMGQMGIDSITLGKGPFPVHLYGKNYYSIPGMLLNWQKNHIRLMRNDNENQPFYSISVILPEGRVFQLMIDPKTYLVVKSILGEPQRTRMVMWTDFSDFVKTSTGYVYPLVQVSSVVDDNTHIAREDFRQEILSIEFATTVPDSCFYIDPQVLDYYNANIAPKPFPIKLFTTGK